MSCAGGGWGAGRGGRAVRPTPSGRWQRGGGRETARRDAWRCEREAASGEGGARGGAARGRAVRSARRALAVRRAAESVQFSLAAARSAELSRGRLLLGLTVGRCGTARVQRTYPVTRVT